MSSSEEKLITESEQTSPPASKKLKLDCKSDSIDTQNGSCEKTTNGSEPKPVSESEPKPVSESYDEKAIDNEYFDSYADTEVHRTMIEDSVRTDTYHKAIMQEPSLIKGKIVCDVGCGSGILSLFCAQAGAKKVFAIDASKIALQAKKVIEANGFQDIITVFQGKAEEIELPEKVDVIVSEWMGYMLLYETMLPSVLHIRDKYLKPGGLMFPDRAVMRVALGESVCLRRYEECTYDFWVALHPMYGLEMSSLADHAVARYGEYAHVFMLPQKDVASVPQTICDLDLNTITAKEIETITSEISVSAMGARRVNCLVCWFDVMFPGDVTLSTSPDLDDTHWQNTILPLPEFTVKQDTSVKGKLVITQCKKRSLDLRLKFSIDGGKEVFKRYRLDENCDEAN